MMRVQFCCRRWTGGEAEYELVKKVDLERELDEHEVERMVDEDRVMVLIVLISIGRLVAVVEPGITVQYWCRRRSRWGRCLGGGEGDVYAGARRFYL